MVSKIRTMLRRSQRALSNDRGNVAVVLALALAPLTVAGLGAVDMARAMSAKIQLQDSLDAAALAAAGSAGSDAALLDQTGDRVIGQNLKLDPDFQLTSSNFTFGANGKVLASATATVTPFIAGLVTGGAMTIGASTEILRAQDKLEIALVLDNTGSMVLSNSPKLATLKTEAAKLVDKLAVAASQNTEPNAVKIALVPFSNTVRVQGTTPLTGYSNASHSGGVPTWLDGQGRSHWGTGRADIFATQYTDRFSMLKALGRDWEGCVEARPQPYDVQETEPTSSDADTLFVPYFWPDEPDSNVTGGSAYNDYLKDISNSSTFLTREQFAGKYTNPPVWRHTGTFQLLGMTYTFGPQAGCTLQPVIRLTTDTASIKTGIANMKAISETNIPLGLMWGWHALTPNAPFADGTPYGTPHTRKIVILMTDGENTANDSGDGNDSYYSGLGYIWQKMLNLTGSSTSTQRTAAMDSRLSTLCTNMKAKNIEIYTIRVEVTSGTSTLLRNCASSPDRFFDVQNVSNLGVAFDAIAGSISNLRISR